MFTDNELAAACDGDLEVLSSFDARGLLIGTDETLDDYVERLRKLRANIGELQNKLEQDGEFLVEDIKLQPDARIPQVLFGPPADQTRELFQFAIDWVPGFYINPRHSWLFGGCAYFIYPEFFAVFIIRRSFSTRRRWLIYDRDELLAHELCHVARIGLESVLFEEHFAYMTARSRFRRLAGAAFRTPLDSFMLLGSTLVLLVSQLVRSVAYPSLVSWPFWALTLGVIAFFIARHRRDRRTLQNAVEALKPRFGKYAQAVACRCADHELTELARIPADESADWINRRTHVSWRWKIMAHRFS